VCCEVLLYCALDSTLLLSCYTSPDHNHHLLRCVVSCSVCLPPLCCPVIRHPCTALLWCSILPCAVVLYFVLPCPALWCSVLPFQKVVCHTVQPLALLCSVHFSCILLRSTLSCSTPVLPALLRYADLPSTVPCCGYTEASGTSVPLPDPITGLEPDSNTVNLACIVLPTSFHRSCVLILSTSTPLLFKY
jgi:hypothetical protein